MKAGWALLGGLVGAGIAVGLSARKTQKDLTLRALALEASMREGGASLETFMLSKGTAIQDELEVYAQGIAQDAGAQYLASTYHIGPTEMRRMEALYRRIM